MIHLPASVRVYLCLSPTDMRRSFDGLHALVRDHLRRHRGESFVLGQSVVEGISIDTLNVAPAPLEVLGQDTGH